MRSVISFAIMALVAGAIIPKYLGQMRAEGNPAPSLMAAHPAGNSAPAAPAGSRSVIISPSGGGHFRVAGRIDGRRLNFMVDTGASVIALTERDAASIGIHPSQRDYSAAMKTANGIVRGAPVKLALVEIDDLMVHDVAAVVLPDSALSDNLLGLSFLQRLHRFEYADGRLVLEQ
jgi:aspartyl protease family protein